MTPINQNLLIAPDFPNGEIVNGFLIRLFSYCGSHSLATACWRLLNRRPGLDGMPSSLRIFHAEVGHLYGDLDSLIDKHTEYNFICCGLPRDKFPAQRLRLVEMLRGPVRLCRLPLLFSKAENCYLKCPECEALQKKEFGFDFVHRRMGAPFVNVCPTHGISLHSANPQLRLFDARCQGKPNTQQINRTMELGRRVEFCMEKPVLSSRYHKDDVVAAMDASGWLGPSQRLHLTEFLKQFSDFFRGSFADERLELMCQSEVYVGNALRALLRSDKAVHPEWCVLFRWFVESIPYPRQRKSSSVEMDVAAVKARGHEAPASRETIAIALNAHKTLSSAANALKVDVRTLGALCKRYNLDVSWRPKSLTREKELEIKSSFEQGMTPAQVAEAFRISVTSAYRQLTILGDVELPSKKSLATRIEADKVEWCLLVQQNSGLSRTQLRQLRRALWMRLHRNVPTWLEANLPLPLPPTNGKKIRPPKVLIAKLNQAVSEAAQLCTQPAKRRVHISQGRLRAHTGVSEFVLKTFVANGAVEDVAEPRSTFINARLSLAVRQVGRPTKGVASVAKKAGLRAETVRDALKK